MVVVVVVEGVGLAVGDGGSVVADFVVAASGPIGSAVRAGAGGDAGPVRNGTVEGGAASDAGGISSSGPVTAVDEPATMAAKPHTAAAAPDPTAARPTRRRRRRDGTGAAAMGPTAFSGSVDGRRPGRRCRARTPRRPLRAAGTAVEELVSSWLSPVLTAVGSPPSPSIDWVWNASAAVLQRLPTA